MISVINLQRKVSLDLAGLRAFTGALTTEVSEAKGRALSIAFVSDSRMKQLNSFFRSRESTTDVLSFPYEADEFDPDKQHLGDIVISAEQAERQADENGLSLEAEIKQLILHGLLHLCGYDHERDHGEMNERELQLRKQLQI